MNTSQHAQFALPILIKSIYWKNVFLRMDGADVKESCASGSGLVNCQYYSQLSEVGNSEKFFLIRNPDGTYSAQSAVFHNSFLRMEGLGVKAPRGEGVGTVNCQYYKSRNHISDNEKFNLIQVNANDGDIDNYALRSVANPNLFLRLDGTGVFQWEPLGSGVVNCQYYQNGIQIQGTSIQDYEKFHLAAYLIIGFEQAKDFITDKKKFLDNRKNIIHQIIAGDNESSSESFSASSFQEQGTGNNLISAASPNCNELYAIVVIDFVFMVMGFIGLYPNRNERIDELIMARIKNNKTKLESLISTLVEAKDANISTKAILIFQFLKAIYNTFSIKQVIGYSFDHLSWWGKAKTLIIAFGTLALWFETGGAAFTLEVLMHTIAVESFIEDTVKTLNKCKDDKANVLR